MKKIIAGARALVLERHQLGAFKKKKKVVRVEKKQIPEEDLKEVKKLIAEARTLVLERHQFSIPKKKKKVTTVEKEQLSEQDLKEVKKLIAEARALVLERHQLSVPKKKEVVHVEEERSVMPQLEINTWNLKSSSKKDKNQQDPKQDYSTRKVCIPKKQSIPDTKQAAKEGQISKEESIPEQKQATKKQQIEKKVTFQFISPEASKSLIIIDEFKKESHDKKKQDATLKDKHNKKQPTTVVEKEKEKEKDVTEKTLSSIKETGSNSKHTSPVVSAPAVVATKEAEPVSLATKDPITTTTYKGGADKVNECLRSDKNDSPEILDAVPNKFTLEEIHEYIEKQKPQKIPELRPDMVDDVRQKFYEVYTSQKDPSERRQHYPERPLAPGLRKLIDSKITNEPYRYLDRGTYEVEVFDPYYVPIGDSIYDSSLFDDTEYILETVLTKMVKRERWGGRMDDFKSLWEYTAFMTDCIVSDSTVLNGIRRGSKYVGSAISKLWKKDT